MPKIEIVSKTPFVWPGPKGELQPTTFVVYKDEKGLVGAINVRKADPSDKDVEDAIAARAGKK